MFTPHARGSTPPFDRYAIFPSVYPACAGIDLVGQFMSRKLLRLPRMRGDRPLLQVSINKAFPFTPHARGSTIKYRLESCSESVYPACAGIDPC